MLSSDLAVLQAPILDSLAFDPFAQHVVVEFDVTLRRCNVLVSR